MPDFRVIIFTALGLFVAGVILSLPIDEEEIIITYETSEPVTYETENVTEKQVSRWVFWDATECQYIVTNTDTVDGNFTLNYVFQSEKEIKSKTKKVNILAGTKEAITIVSPFYGVSSIRLNVVPPYKTVSHQTTEIKKIKVWDRLWDLIWLFGK